MKKTRFPAVVTGLALACSSLVIPQAVAVERPTDTPEPQATITETDIADLLSYESADGTTVVPGQTITLAPDHYDERLSLLNVDPTNGTFRQWDLALHSATGAVTVTAPENPTEQIGTIIAEYGEHEFRVRTNESREVYFTLNFREAEPDSSRSPWDALRELLANLGGYPARLLGNLFPFLR